MQRPIRQTINDEQYIRSGVIELRMLNPYLICEKIGKVVGRSREWVRHVLIDHGLPTRAIKPLPLKIGVVCGYCGCTFFLKLAEYRRALKKNKSRKIYCSLSCMAKDNPLMRSRRENAPTRKLILSLKPGETITQVADKRFQRALWAIVRKMRQRGEIDFLIHTRLEDGILSIWRD